MVRLDSKRSCWTSPKGHHNRWSLMAVVANQAVAFDKSMLTACRRHVHMLVTLQIIWHKSLHAIWRGGIGRNCSRVQSMIHSTLGDQCGPMFADRTGSGT